MKYLVLIALMGLAAACSKNNDDLNTSLSENGCTVDYHASNKGDLCSQLQDDRKDSCGMRSMREEAFESNGCDGQFTPHY